MIRNLILLIGLIGICASCAPNREKRGAEIAREETIKVLNIPDSYEPVETEVDSLFATVYNDPQAIGAAAKLIDLYKDEESVKRDYRNAKSNMSLWSDSSSTYAEGKYDEAKEDFDKAEKELNKVEREIAEQVNVIKIRNKQVKNGEFIGWAIGHRFRCENGAGVRALHDMIFLVDEDMEHCVISFTTDEYDNYCIQNIKDIIDGVLSE